MAFGFCTVSELRLIKERMRNISALTKGSTISPRFKIMFPEIVSTKLSSIVM